MKAVSTRKLAEKKARRSAENTEDMMNNAFTVVNEDYIDGYNYATNKLRERRTNMLKQKIAGFIMIAAGAVSVPVLNMDITAALALVPVGIYLVFARKSALF